VDPIEFQSSTPSIVLSWIVFLLWLKMVVNVTADLFKKKKNRPYVVTVWTGICILVLSPIRYIWFIVLLFNFYCIQSLSAFMSFLFIETILYIVMGKIMGNIFALLPSIIVNNRLFVEEKDETFDHIVISSIFVPLGCILSSFVFSAVLPYVACTLQWTDYKDLIKATNGQTAFIYKGFQVPFSHTTLPEYFNQGSTTNKGELRHHVASLYMTKDDEFKYYKTQYPDLFTRKNPALQLVKVEVDYSDVSGGEMIQGTVKLPVSIEIDLPVTLATSNAKIASVPDSVTIPKGEWDAKFEVITTKPKVATSVTLYASSGGVTREYTFKVNP
jgi:hypothetical protein